MFGHDNTRRYDSIDGLSKWLPARFELRLYHSISFVHDDPIDFYNIFSGKLLWLCFRKFITKNWIDSFILNENILIRYLMGRRIHFKSVWMATHFRVIRRQLARRWQLNSPPIQIILNCQPEMLRVDGRQRTHSKVFWIVSWSKEELIKPSMITNCNKETI